MVLKITSVIVFAFVGSIICADVEELPLNSISSDSFLFQEIADSGYKATATPSKNQNISNNSQAPSTKPPLSKRRFKDSLNIEADLLIWRVQQEGNDYASTGTALIVPDGISLPFLIEPGTIYRPPSNTSVGFKLEAGVNLSHDLWDVALIYTWLKYKGSDSIFANDFNTAIQPLFNYSNVLGSVLSAGFVQHATCQSQLFFNSLDGELGKNFFITPSFYLRLFFGLKGAWSREYLTTQYFVNDSTVITSNLGNNQVKFSQHVSGLGPRVGWYGVWQYSKHFGLFANTAASLVWSRFKTTALSIDTNFPGGPVVIANQQYLMHTLIPVFEFIIGIQGEKIYKDGSRALVAAGWESQTWFYQAQHSSSIADISLNMNGLTLKFRYDY